MLGKNVPCPCGSGKKYKRCCMGKQPESKPVGGIGPAHLYEVLRDVPVVDEEGFRIVSPAQAAMDFAKPLWDLMPPETDEQAQNLLNTGMALWDLALGERCGSRTVSRRNATVRALAESGVPSPAEFADMMVERHLAMFPDAGRGKGGFYERERVVDPLPSWTPFDEDRLPRGDMPPADTESNRKARQAVGEFDHLLRAGGTDAFEREMQRIGVAFEEAFDDWLGRLGVEEDQAVPLANLAARFMYFLARYGGEPFDGKPDQCVPEFLMTWLFRKARLDGGTHSAAPRALLLLGTYLDRLGHTQGLEHRFWTVLSPRLEEFERILAAFYGPSGAPEAEEEKENCSDTKS